VSLPILRKDFIFDEYQLYEAALAGADALLLIVAALDDAALMRLHDIAENQLGMDALVEVHTSDELLRANSSGSRLIGINNRDLRTFEVSLNVSLQLVREMSLDALFVSESGLRTRDDLDRLHRLGFRGFLIGESLMRSSDPARTLRELLNRKDEGER
jgi:indole-3-glycerol phosphate synthase